MSATQTYPLRLPRSLKQAVERLSRQDGTSINQFVATAVVEKVSALETARFFADGRISRLSTGSCAAAAAPRLVAEMNWRGATRITAAEALSPSRGEVWLGIDSIVGVAGHIQKNKPRTKTA